MDFGGGIMKVFDVGFCIAPEKLSRPSRSWKKVGFKARAFLIEVPSVGLILIDTGYGNEYFKAVSRFPGRLYNFLLPVYQEVPLVDQLKQKGIAPSDISYIFITHFHTDHIAALSDFKECPWIYRSDALEALQALTPLSALREGFFPSLIPPIPKGSIPLNKNDFDQPFFSSTLKSTSLFKGKIEAVDLPGHALGQMGLFIPSDDPFLFIADAAWSEGALHEGELPGYVGLHLQHKPKEYQKTFYQLHLLSKSIKCIPTHETRELL